MIWQELAKSAYILPPHFTTMNAVLPIYADARKLSALQGGTKSQPKCRKLRKTISMVQLYKTISALVSMFRFGRLTAMK